MTLRRKDSFSRKEIYPNLVAIHTLQIGSTLASSWSFCHATLLVKRENGCPIGAAEKTVQDGVMTLGNIDDLEAERFVFTEITFLLYVPNPYYFGTSFENLIRDI